jgi:hypothetical protein
LFLSRSPVERIELLLRPKLVAEPATGIELERATRLAAIAGGISQSLGFCHSHRDIRIDPIFLGRRTDIRDQATRVF